MITDRRRIMSTSQSLPYDYEVEYLESTGTQWIDTGYIINSQSKLICNYKVVKANPPFDNGVCPFGSRVSWQDRMYNIFSPINMKTQVHICWGNTSYYKMNLDLIGLDITAIIDIPNKFGQVGTLSNTFTTQTFASNNLPVYLFCLNNNGVVMSATNIELVIYNFKVEENGVAVLDYIPVIKNSFPCMYDKVSGNFFYNQGTDSFIAGPRIGGGKCLVFNLLGRYFGERRAA